VSELSEWNIQRLFDWIRDSVSHNDPSSRFDFVSGVSQFAHDFAIWRDGEQYFGSSEYTIKELNEALRRYMEDHL
jgi:hypothetical protein